MGRKRINEEGMPARFPAGTLARIDAVLDDGEKRADLIRQAVERELKRRERAKSAPSACVRPGSKLLAHFFDLAPCKGVPL